MKTEVMLHCGNAPKMERVIDLTIALARKDAAAAKKHIREDFVWSELGGEEVLSFETLESALKERPDVDAMHVTNGLSHGNGAMCEGTLLFADGDELYFCSVATFVSTAKDALIKRLHIYFIPA